MLKINDLPVVERLRQLYQLQQIDSALDEILKLKGELPNEVNELSDEIAALHTRQTRLEAALADLNGKVNIEQTLIKNSEKSAEKYGIQIKTIKNNREFDALSKEITEAEYQISLSKKETERLMITIEEKGRDLEKTTVNIKNSTKLLEQKRNELSKISEKTDKDEEKFRKRSDTFRKLIDTRVLKSYDKIRTSYRNGMSVVSMVRNSCGGCYNVLPPQLQLEIGMYKRLLVCEHCGRILVDDAIINSVNENPVTKAE
jgi:uncharacterized protein